MRACLTTAPPLYSADDMIPDLAGEAAASPAAPDVTGNRSTPGTADCLVHAGEYQPTADHVTQDEQAQHHRLRADQHQVTARPPGLRPHCHELVQGVAVHVGQFRQVNDYPCPGRGQYGERAHDVRGSAHIEFPAQRDDHAACARTFLCTDPGHGLAVISGQPARSGHAPTASSSCGQPYARKPAPSPAPAQQDSRRDDQTHPAELPAGHQPGTARPVGPRQPQGLDLTLEHGDLMPQQQDLRVLGAAGTSLRARAQMPNLPRPDPGEPRPPGTDLNVTWPGACRDAAASAGQARR